MSEPAPTPPSPPEPELLFCHECGMAVDLLELPPVPPSSPPRLCPFCSRGFLEEDPPPLPPSPPPLPPVATPPPPPPARACPCCGGLGVPADDHPASPSSSPPPPPPPFSDLSDDPDGLGLGLLGAFAGGQEGRLVGNFASAAIASALRDTPRRAAGAGAAAFETILHRQLGLLRNLGGARAAGGEPPAPAASIAALPTVEVAEPAAACAICKDDLPLASQARRLPCAHLYHSSCIVTWLELHNSCPVCRFSIPSAAAGAPEGAEPAEQDSQITIRFSFTTSTRRRGDRVHGDAAAAAAAPVSASPTQLAQAVTGDGAGGPANSGETVSSEWPPRPESDAVMSEVREEDGFFD